MRLWYWIKWSLTVAHAVGAGLLGECLQIDNSNLRSEGLQSEKADAHAARFKTLKNEAISMIAPVSHQATVKRSPRKVFAQTSVDYGWAQTSLSKPRMGVTESG